MSAGARFWGLEKAEHRTYLRMYAVNGVIRSTRCYYVRVPCLCGRTWVLQRPETTERSSGFAAFRVSEAQALPLPPAL